MKLGTGIVAALLLTTGYHIASHKPATSQSITEFVIGEVTHWDFGPPFNYYEIFVVKQRPGGSLVERILLTPAMDKCRAPAKVEYTAHSTTTTVKEFLDGLDPCQVSEKTLAKERRRSKKGLVFSYAVGTMKVECGNTTRVIRTNILDRDWFATKPDTPKGTEWTLRLIEKLNAISGPGVSDKPMIATVEETSATHLSGSHESLKELEEGKFDNLFGGTDESVSRIYSDSEAKHPEPTVEFLNSEPLQPTEHELPSYPKLAWLVSKDGETSAVVELDTSGNVAAVISVQGFPFFEQSVRDALKSWKFPPNPPNAEVVAAARQVTVRFRFSLNCKE